MLYCYITDITDADIQKLAGQAKCKRKNRKKPLKDSTSSSSSSSSSITAESKSRSIPARYCYLTIAIYIRYISYM